MKISYFLFHFPQKRKTSTSWVWKRRIFRQIQAPVIVVHSKRPWHSASHEASKQINIVVCQAMIPSRRQRRHSRARARRRLRSVRRRHSALSSHRRVTWPHHESAKMHTNIAISRARNSDCIAKICDSSNNSSSCNSRLIQMKLRRLRREICITTWNVSDELAWKISSKSWSVRFQHCARKSVHQKSTFCVRLLSTAPSWDATRTCTMSWPRRMHDSWTSCETSRRQWLPNSDETTRCSWPEKKNNQENRFVFLMEMRVTLKFEMRRRTSV